MTNDSVFGIETHLGPKVLLNVTRTYLPVVHLPGWATCPNCNQSATGKYGRYHSCRRCNWNEGRGVAPLRT